MNRTQIDKIEKTLKYGKGGWEKFKNKRRKHENRFSCINLRLTKI